ncbi:MAG: hypothetical protein Crog4KO_19030 [Crocinitomicaceae bacterium]
MAEERASKYRNYVNKKVKAQGSVQLDPEQFSVMFNLVWCEALREAFKVANQFAANTKSRHKYDIQIYEVDQFIRRNC